MARPVQADSQVFEHTSSNTTTFTQQPQQQVFRPNIVMIQASCLIHCQFNHLFSTRSKSDLPRHHALAAANDAFNSVACHIQVYIQGSENFCGQPLTFTHQAQQQVFCPNIVVLKALGLFLCQCEYFACPRSESVKPISHGLNSSYATGSSLHMHSSDEPDLFLFTGVFNGSCLYIRHFLIKKFPLMH